MTNAEYLTWLALWGEAEELQTIGTMAETSDGYIAAPDNPRHSGCHAHGPRSEQAMSAPKDLWVIIDGDGDPIESYWRYDDAIWNLNWHNKNSYRIAQYALVQDDCEVKA